MNRNDWFAPKWLWLKKFAWMGAAGAAIFIACLALGRSELSMIGLVLTAPLIVWLAVIPILHWKDRYIGQRSGLWGGILVVETSGWSKLVYWFRHVLPDWRQADRYKDAL